MTERYKTNGYRTVRKFLRYCWSTSSRSEGCKMGRTSGGLRHLLKPRDDAPHVDRHCCEHLLQMGLWQPPIATVPCPKSPHALGDGSLNPRPPRIALLPGFCCMG